MKQRILITLLGVICVSQLRGQAVASAQISGIVADPTGAAVPNASISARQTDTGLSRATISGPNGTYALPNLPVGPYTLEVAAAGFAPYLHKAILLSVGNHVTINVTLALASVSEQVQVTSSPNMVEARDTAISQVIDQQRMVDLPLDGRQATSLILLSGASVATGTFVSTKTYGSGDIAGSSSISIAGGQSNWTNYMMDGGDNNHSYTNVNLPFPFPDAIQEFSVQTHGLSARYGLHPGGTVNIITKSGTNRYHGDLFEFVRNGSVNARNFFAATHDSLKRNQFGGDMGGPVLRDRLFFFGGYQGTRIRTSPPETISFVPTQTVLNGDFSQLESAGCQSSGRPRTILNPATGQAFANSRVSPSLFNPQALALLKYVPVSDDPCGRITYGIPNPENEDQYLGRLDWNLSTKHSLFGRYFRADLQNPPVFQNNLLLTTRAGVTDRSQSMVLADTYSLSPITLNSVHATFTRLFIRRGTASDVINPRTVGINVFNGAPNFIQMTVSGYFNVGCGTCAPAVYASNSMQAADDVDLIRGRHHFSLGANWIHNQLNYTNVYISNGTWTFNGQSTSDALLDFMLGLPSNFTQGNIVGSNLRDTYWGVYGQDDVQLSRRLHAHFGLRWEPFLPAVDRFDRFNHVDPAGYAQGRRSSVYVNAPPGVFFVGDAGIGRPYSNAHYANLEPRLGLAWDPTGSGRQTVRAAYGIFYDKPMINYSSNVGQGPPWGNSVAIASPAGGLTNPYQGIPGGNPFPTPFPPPRDQAFPAAGAYRNVPLVARPTYAQQWNLSYQRQFGEWLMSATYMGNKTTHLWTSTEQNPAVYIPGMCAGAPCSSTRNTNQRRVLYLQNPVAGAYVATVALLDDGANAQYNGLLLSARHRFSRNYTMLVNYAYSHCISESVSTGTLGGPSYQNPYHRSGDRANCEFDRRQVMNASLVAVAPHFSERWTQRFLGNWQIAPMVSVRSGSWFSPRTGVDNSLTGVGLDRPNVVGAPYVRNTSTRQWLDPAAFAPNALGTFGNAGAYSLSGPAYLGMDLGISRLFSLGESRRVEVRFEFFNAANHVNFSNPQASRQSSSFGRILSAADPRILQFAMKYHF